MKGLYYTFFRYTSIHLFISLVYVFNGSIFIFSYNTKFTPLTTKYKNKIIIIMLIIIITICVRKYIIDDNNKIFLVQR